MKKILALVLALALAMSLAACGGGNSGGSQPSGGDAQQSQPSGGDQSSGGSELPGAGMKIGLVCDKIGVNPFLTEMVRGLNETAETYGFTPTVVECADTAAFEDVAPESWYAGYVGWAMEKGIVEGDGQGHFLPDTVVSAETGMFRVNIVAIHRRL